MMTAIVNSSEQGNVLPWKHPKGPDMFHQCEAWTNMTNGFVALKGRDGVGEQTSPILPILPITLYLSQIKQPE